MSELLCSRVACGEPAVAVLLMSPQDTTAWLVAPDHPSAPEGVPLCAKHADRISVPFGWTLQDDRPPAKKKRRRKKPADDTVAEPKIDDAAAHAPAEQITEAQPDAGAPAAVSDAPAAESKDEPVSGDAGQEDGGASARVDDSVAAASAGGDVPEPTATSEPEPAVVEPEPEPEPVAVEPEPEPEPAVVEPEPEPEPAVVEPEPEPEPVAELEREPFVEDDPNYVPPEYQFREDGVTGPHDDPTIQLPAISIDPASPSEVPLDSDRVAAAIDEEAPRLSVVPPDDDPSKTYDFSDDGQGALWNEPEPAEVEPDESTPLLQRAFRVVRDD